MTRRLVIIRHAKAEDESASGRDHDRSLTERGTAAAAALGSWLKEQGVRPDLVLCSTAARTRETWAAASETGGFAGLVDHDQSIYNASPATLMGLLREAGGSARTVVLIGHNPGVVLLAAGLAEGNAVDVDFGAVFRTAGCAILEVPVNWTELAAGVADVIVTNQSA